MSRNLRIMMIFSFFMTLFQSPAFGQSEHACRRSAQQAAEREFARSFDDCFYGGGGGQAPTCNSDWECSSGESCISNVCVIRPVCNSNIVCDECFLGQRTCRTIDCRGIIQATYQEQCRSRNTTACGACIQSFFGSSFGYSYEIFIGLQPVAFSAVHEDRSTCMNAKAADPRCNGN